MNSPIRVLVADSEKIYREGLRVIFSRGNEVRVVGQACTGPEACEKARRIQPDLVLMEVDMPEMDGFTATRHILAARPETRVAMLTSSHSDADVMNAIKAGVHGYITKDISVGALVDSIRRVAEGDAVEVGQAVATIEAMKMEAAITAQVAGTVRRVVTEGITRDTLARTSIAG